jgi:hypothetical protein
MEIMKTENYIPTCKKCGRKLGQVINITGEQPFIACSSDYIENCDYCMSCMIEHCCTTNCLGCNFNTGKYSDCRFFDMKQHYMKKD